MDPLFPVRCTSSCGRLLAPYETYIRLLGELGRPDLALDKMRVRFSCCRTWYLTYVPDVGLEY